MKAVSGRPLADHECTMWIRPSTGRLCVDLTPIVEFEILAHPNGPAISQSFLNLFEPHEESKIIASMSLDDYHEICFWHLSRKRSLSLPTNASVQLGMIYCTSGASLNNVVEIARIPDCKFQDDGWSAVGSRMESGWSRVDSGDATEHISRIIYYSWLAGFRYWLAQANHIFSRLNIMSNYENYVFITEIRYKLKIFGPRDSSLSGYLFLCPVGDLQSDIATGFRIPDCAAYWSLDPMGVQRLTMGEAIRRGFPSIKLEMEVLGYSWDGSVYAGLHQFHQRKRFDSDSQDVARHLGYPLFEVSSELDAAFVHVEERDPSNEDGDPDRDKIFQGNGEHDESEVYGLPSLADAEMPPPSRAWNIIMAIQFALIMMLGAFSLYDHLLAHSTQATNKRALQTSSVYYRLLHILSSVFR
ncbi:hypothetical protein C8R44DRAFT_381653 [Mycena epipterygia]|nr:hypothetical protein C8R44DRAFT_813708 [Mycena epipterygia]KAJ7094979.1 hypothetical protein C8R44DRAFT_381653 [Mycena epipterygia]